MKDTIFVYPLVGLSPQDLAKIDSKVELEVKKIIDKLKVSHAKFEDPNFGPTAEDEFGG